jgi:methionyl-tRNA synthetase
LQARRDLQAILKEIWSMTTYVTVAIPYVNALPHLGYAFELVQADVFARARRLAGDPVRFLGGTDDYSLKNVLAAEAAGIATADFVDAHASRFEALGSSLRLSFDDFIRTSSDPRHAPAVERLWQGCAAGDDLYKRRYSGDYCVGCEQFYGAGDLVEGRCPEHRTAVERVAEETGSSGSPPIRTTSNDSSTVESSPSVRNPSGTRSSPS